MYLSIHNATLHASYFIGFGNGTEQHTHFLVLYTGVTDRYGTPSTGVTVGNLVLFSRVELTTLRYIVPGSANFKDTFKKVCEPKQKLQVKFGAID